jgi:hypothetical protein
LPKLKTRQKNLIRRRQKAPDGNQALTKNTLQKDYIMKSNKKKWEPRIINIMADGSVIEDLTGYVIPAGHTYYNVIKGIYTERI